MVSLKVPTILFVVLFSTANAKHIKVCVPVPVRTDCGEHERFSDCGSEEQCGSSPYFDDLPKFRACYNGCLCKNGYSRTQGPNGTCIENSKCLYYDPTSCRKSHTKYSYCGSEERCRPSYADFDYQLDLPEKCSRGCFCQKGYRKSPNGKCVKISDCPFFVAPDCGEHETYSDCGFEDICEGSRDDNGNECLSGCLCDAGFSRLHGRYGACVKDPKESKEDSKCPPDQSAQRDCSRFETYSDCGFEKICGSTNNDTDYLDGDARECSSGCFCKPGYSRVPVEAKKDKPCVLPESCPCKGLTCSKGFKWDYYSCKCVRYTYEYESWWY